MHERVVETALAAHCLDISEPMTLRGRMSAYRLYTARWSLTDLEPASRQPTVPVPGRQPPAGPGTPVVSLPPDPGEWGIPRLPLRYDRAVLAIAVVLENVRTTVAVVQGRGCDVVAHQQAARPEQLLTYPDAEPGPDDQRAGGRNPVGVASDGAAGPEGVAHRPGSPGVTDEQLCHLQDAFTNAADQARATMDRYVDPDGAGGRRPIHQDDQQLHRPQQPGAHRGREVARSGRVW